MLNRPLPEDSFDGKTAAEFEKKPKKPEKDRMIFIEIGQNFDFYPFSRYV